MTGSGTVGDPFVIYDVNDLQDMNLDLAAYYELANDIDASATIGWNAGAGFVPIWTPPVTGFSGHFDGKDYTISSLFINRPATNYVALFGFIDHATIQNVTLTGANITGRNRTAGLGGYVQHTTIQNVTLIGANITGRVYTAGLAGDCEYTCTITSVHCDGAIQGLNLSGGLIGYAYEITVSGCSTSGTVAGQAWIGGMFGSLTLCSCVSCHSTAAVTCDMNHAGGLIGIFYGSDISQCYATGDVIAVAGGVNELGGFVGTTDTIGTISRCFATGNVLCDATAFNNGGFVGVNEVAISDCYATGAVISGWGGGFAGTNEGGGSIERCYAVGAITDLGNCGGLVALGGWVPAVASFWDVETTGLATSDSGTGLTTAEMKSRSTFMLAGWDFMTIWSICPGVNGNYPCLVGITPSCRYVSKRHIPWHPTEPNRGKVLSRMGSL